VRPRRLQRSELAVPATSERFFAKAAASVTDALFLDLEDAVADDRKEAARRQAIDALNGLDWGRKTVSVRVNGLDTRWGQRDILEIASRCPRLDMILLPKVGSAFEVRFVDQLLTGIEREQGRSKRIGIEVLIETARGVAHAEEIAGSADRLEAMIFGVGDYSVDMQTFDTVFGSATSRYAVLTHADEHGVRHRHWNDHWHFALARVANACRAHGLRPIDGPYTDFGDAEGYRASAIRATALGFEGKWAIHPSQVAIANEVFSPSRAQIEWATGIVEALRSASEAGAGAFQQNRVLVDLAHGKLAGSIIERARAIDGAQEPVPDGTA
jgi:malyl-CoA/(S)-citramalyl-CoA lyase